MYKQTIWLANKLPHLAQIYCDADATNSSEWELVQWQDKLPSEVLPTDVSVATGFTLNGKKVPNVFPNRTAAFRFGEEWASLNQIRNDGSWIWKWQEDGHTVYQTVLPINRPNGKSRRIKTMASATSGSTMVRVSESAHRTLRRVAAREGRSLQSTLEAAIEEHDRRSYFAELDRCYAALQADPVAWQEEIEERSVWDVALLDGIDPDDSTEFAGVDLERQSA